MTDKVLDKPLKIYLAGPYGPKGPDLHDAVQQAHQNTLRAIDVGIELMKKGHIPFIPHLMHFVHMQTKQPFPGSDYRAYDMAWLPSCEALYYIGPSTGADAELKWAQDNGKTVFTSLDDVPDVKAPTASTPLQPVATNPTSTEDTRTASKGALKTIYGIIIGLAITQSLRQAFFPNNVSLGYEDFLPRNFRSIILLFAFIPTVVRFAHGAYIHLGAGEDKQYRPIADFGFFLFQGVV